MARPRDLPSALETLDDERRAILERLPREPGVYLLKDRQGVILYVGKAKNLHSRVRSYFTRSGDSRAFVALLDRLLGDVETIVTRNEKEALLLENNLIKRHRPRFNVMLRDDKSYLVLRIDPRARFPRLEVTRRMASDGARYFGPFHSASACRETLRVVNRYFRLRTCTDRVMESRTRPCLQYQIGRCPAPCVLEVDPTEYAEQVEDVSLFLKGRGDELLAALEARMRAAAAELHFEVAARLRDQLEAIRRSLVGQQAVGTELRDQDVFGFHREGTAVDFVVLNLRRGRLVGRQPFSFSGQEFPDEELLSSFVNLYYDRGEAVPEQVLVPVALEDAPAKAQWLEELRGAKVEILVPQRGDKRRLLELAQRNAASNFHSRRERNADLEAALAKLQQRLQLARLPRRVECYDVSQLQGQEVVASLVVLQDGVPEPKSYRHFAVRGAKDDFAALYEVLARRLRRARQGDAGWALPELVVVDGGKGQLSVAQAAFRDASFPPEVTLPDLVALAKERATEESPEASEGAGSSAGPRGEPDRPDRVFLAGVKDPIRLRANTAELFLLSRIRDEAHRFAITYHKHRRRRRALHSELDDIPGIGPERRRQLLRTLGSVKRVRAASREELLAVPGITARAAEAVLLHFAGATPPHPDEDS
ncbi:MAG: excinuclease ABC subunit UvrC [Deltaproteobacteria bacterium]|nr:excinuclease ABC subunit UvrC [Deltaproteobacteria bacterium]